MEDANTSNIENYKDSEQNAYKGKLLVYIQSLKQTGKGSVKLSSSGIKTSEFTLDVVSIE
jgi:hypothetical protein